MNACRAQNYFGWHVCFTRPIHDILMKSASHKAQSRLQLFYQLRGNHRPPPQYEFWICGDNKSLKWHFENRPFFSAFLCIIAHASRLLRVAVGSATINHFRRWFFFSTKKKLNAIWNTIGHTNAVTPTWSACIYGLNYFESTIGSTQNGFCSLEFSVFGHRILLSSVLWRHSGIVAVAVNWNLYPV